LRQPYRERQEDQLGSRELVVDMIVLSNTSNRLRRIMKRVFSQDRVFCFARNDTDTRLAIFLAQEVTRGGQIRNSSFLRAPACVFRPACSGRKRCEASLRSGQQGLRHELLCPRVQFRFGWRRPGFLTHLIVQVLAFDPDIDGVV
jgi:hypothetical protein